MNLRKIKVVDYLVGHLNTSLVTMNRIIKAKFSRNSKFKYISCYYESKVIEEPKGKEDAFKYISCYYESYIYNCNSFKVWEI